MEFLELSVERVRAFEVVVTHFRGDEARVEFEARDLLVGPGVGVDFVLPDFLVEGA